MNKKRLFDTLMSALVTIVAMASVSAAQGVDPANFVKGVNNKFFPLKPGTTFFYEGEKDGIPSSNQTFVTHQTKRILGVKCTEVHDQAFENGILAEDTLDWFAQDIYGNVWYFGEDSKELDPAGNVISTEGSWEAGVDDAQPGIIMEANPQVGDRYHQEFARGVAEDMARVLSLEESTCVLYGCFDHLLLTKETSRLNPGVVEQKYYAENIGFILAVTVKGGDERSELVRITTS
jgi:hypothetical protein